MHAILTLILIVLMVPGKYHLTHYKISKGFEQSFTENGLQTPLKIKDNLKDSKSIVQ